MFAFDDLARKIANNLIMQPSLDLKPIMKMFVYLPFEHHEDLKSQLLCVELFENLKNECLDGMERNLIEGGLDYAKKHLAVIERFGRFPHRNDILGRTPTPEEEDYLKNGGETFGQQNNKK